MVGPWVAEAVGGAGGSVLLLISTAKHLNSHSWGVFSGDLALGHNLSLRGGD